MLASFFITFGLNACQKDKPASDPTTTLDAEEADSLNEQSTEIRYLALGDSYTIGESVPEAERWPNQLVDSLRARQEASVWNDAAIVATTGWTTANLSNGMDAAQVDTMTWDLVSLLIGVNNQYQGLSVDDYANEFDVLARSGSVLDGRSIGSGLCGEHSRLRVHPVWGIQPKQHLGRAADIQRHLPRPNASCGHQPLQHHAHLTTTSGHARARRP